MQIIEKTYTLNGKLDIRKKTDKIILHHRAGNGDVESIDRIHKNKGWVCIGYHFYVRKDGSIYRGRQENAVGAHAYGSNSTSIGICAEGNFETDTMPKVQKEAIIELVNYLKNKYPIMGVIRHKDVNSTACPGRNYPYYEIVHSEQTFIQKVQSVIGAKVDGIVGPETLSKLPLLSKKTNRKHAIVKLVQQKLITLGYGLPKYGTDGDYGSETEGAIKKFQINSGLTPDGIVGKNTWKKLLV